MKVSPATRARRRDSGRIGHELPAAMANSLLWDVILEVSDKIPVRVPMVTKRAGGLVIAKQTVPWYPVVRFKGRYYLVAEGNPWPAFRRRCVLLARPDDPRGDLCITNLGVVEAFVAHPKRRGLRKTTIHGVQEDITPVLELPTKGGR